jgi:DNA-binding Lrp family transcriptional regulator
MAKRKKKILDGIDREILRALLYRRPLVSRQIAKYVGISSPAIFPRLDQLKDLGIIKISRISGIRYFEREFNYKIKKIKSPRSIHWDLDIKKNPYNENL